jgi:hypothetical protein
LHTLLDITSLDTLLSHPVIGNSWEGFVIENLIDENSIHQYQPYFYRTQRGAEIDLVLARGGMPEIAIEVKRASNPKAEARPDMSTCPGRPWSCSSLSTVNFVDGPVKAVLTPIASLERQWQFAMREIVCVGSAQEVQAFLATHGSDPQRWPLDWAGAKGGW